MVNINIALFDKSIHDRKDFSCGVLRMDNWFKGSISKEIKHNRIQVWCATDDTGALLGFYALSAHSIVRRNVGKHSVPATYLNAIAVHEDYQRREIGKDLLFHAIEKCVMVSSNIGVAEFVLDVKEDEVFSKRVKFYEKYGFRAFEGWESRMTLSIQIARSSL